MTILSRLFTPTSRRPASTSRDLHSRSRRFDLSGLLGAFGKTADTLQKYQDIPLRFQRQWLTTFLAISMLIGVVAGVYLNVTSRAAIAGREIQNLEADIITNQRLNADLQTQISGILSNISLEERAAAAGFVPVARTDIKYLVVPGYVPAQGPNLLAATPADDPQGQPAEYSETLFTWLARQLDVASTPLARTH